MLNSVDIGRNGLVIFMTGLSGSGKTTLANALAAEIEKTRPVTLLDGDVCREILCSGLGFSKAGRDMNIARLGFVAAEIARHGGVAIVSAIAPYDEARQKARAMVEKFGKFVLVYVDTPLAICEERDCKGLYKLAREGKLPAFTGISDPYEPPQNPEITYGVDDSPEKVLDALEV